MADEQYQDEKQMHPVESSEAGSAEKDQNSAQAAGRLESRIGELMKKEGLSRDEAEWQAGMEEVAILESKAKTEAGALEQRISDRAAHIEERAKDQAVEPKQKAILETVKETLNKFFDDIALALKRLQEGKPTPKEVQPVEAEEILPEVEPEELLPSQIDTEPPLPVQEYKDAKEAEKALDEFLRRPMAEIYQDLRRGVRHPRLLQRFFSLEEPEKKNFVQDKPVNTPEDLFALTALSASSADSNAYRLLSSGMASIEGVPEDVRAEIKRSAIQMENDFYGDAAKTLEKLLKREDVKGSRVSGSLVEMHGFMVERAKERELVRITEQLSNELYDRLGVETPERKAEIEQRRRDEFLMRYGEVKFWKSIKPVKKSSGSERRYYSAEDQIEGDAKAMIAEIGPPKFTADGQLLDTNGSVVPGIRKNEAGDIIDEKGRVIPGFKEGETMKAVAKSTISDYQFRDLIPPDATDANEWLAGYEAMALESDVVPATVLRETKGGRMSLQKLIQFEGELGPKTAISAFASELRKEKLPIEFETLMSNQNKEEIALFQRLQRAADAGVPNIVLVPEGDKMRGYSIDNGLSNPAGTSEFLFSALLYERAKQEVSQETLAKLEKYKTRLSAVGNALSSVLRHDTGSAMRDRRETVDRYLENKRFEHYRWTLPSHHALRDQMEIETTDKNGTKVLKKVSRLQQTYPDRKKSLAESA